MELNDCWISTGKNYKQGLTWCDGNNIPQSRLDYVFTSEHMNFPLNDIFLRKAPNVDNTRLSDHLGINFELSTGENIRDVERSRGLGDVYKRQVYIRTIEISTFLYQKKD